ncbi:hypothetical protein VT06_16570 [Arsukibacterium sp. MJ3]|uniref:hypothetical protein n=1 Tax=Arsukibacterium sp. MJ3 TaxID=1632859 RepID=UPI000626F9B9|nr:hypothetical protein [Arsukibacterium sp. MJ3]KKO47533.1 hypothetical protein VT06_16570 [Arsukibacterium sp. MJ3]
MKYLNYLVSSFYIFIAWLSAYWLVQYFGAGFSAVEGYSIVSGWWAAAYISSKLSIKVRQIYPLAFIYFVFFFLHTISGGTWLYRDANSTSTLATLTIGIVQTVFVVSPVFFNKAVDFVTDYIKKKEK